MEVCRKHDLVVTNTWSDLSDDQLVTYYDLSAKPTDAISSNKFAQLDLVLVTKEWACTVEDVTSIAGCTLQSHHFLVKSRVNVIIPKAAKRHKQASRNPTVMKDPEVQRKFATVFANVCVQNPLGHMRALCKI